MEHKLNRALWFEFESNRPYIPLNTFRDGLMVAISIPHIQCVHCSSAGLLHMLCYLLQELRVVTLYVCKKNPPRLSMRKNIDLLHRYTVNGLSRLTMTCTKGRPLWFKSDHHFRIESERPIRIQISKRISKLCRSLINNVQVQHNTHSQLLSEETTHYWCCWL